jgi:hypothetical protein
MTRINLSVPPKKLTDKHLLAEHREIVRIPNCIRKGRYSMKDQPKKFTLGKGHVKFFYDKLTYLNKRYNSLYTEAKNRGFNVTYFGDAFNGIDNSLMNDYVPTKQDRIIIKERLVSKDSIYKNII